MSSVAWTPRPEMPYQPDEINEEPRTASATSPDQREQGTKAPANPLPASGAQQKEKASPYASLAPYGEHVLYYRQRDNPASKLTDADFSQAKLGLTETQREDAMQEGADGVCQGMALAWAAERLQTTNSSGVRQKLSFQPKHFKAEPDASSLAADPGKMSDEKKAEKRALTARGASAHLIRPPKASSSQNSDERSSLETRQQASLGLKPFHEDTGGGGVLTPDVQLHSSSPDDAKQKPFATIMTEAGQRLEKGQAVTASMTIKDNDGRLIGRHEMAMYKSRAGNLRFFEADGGEFQVKDPEKFFAAYSDLKKSDRGWNFEFVTGAHNPDKLTYYKR